MEGILFGGFFLTKDEFITLFKEFLQSEIGEKFLLDVRRLEQDIGKKTKQEVFTEWERLQTDYFKNPNVKLLVGVKLHDSTAKGFEWSSIIDESAAIAQGSISLSTSAVRDALLELNASEKALLIDKLLKQHYQSLITSLGETPPEDQDRWALCNYYKSKDNETLRKFSKKINFTKPVGFLRKILEGEYEEHLFDHISLWQSVYGKMVNAEGKVADAYMNHMGAKHTLLFNIMSKDVTEVSLDEINKTFNGKSVKEEEGSNFVQLLLDSLNTTPWIAGGDIVIYGHNRKIIHNIQLKTTKFKAQGFHIRLNKLNNVLNLFNAELNHSYDYIAEQMFEKMKADASPASNLLETTVENNIYDLVRKNLGI